MKKVFRSLYWKLSLAFVLVAFITTSLVAIFIRLTSPDRLNQLVIEQQRASLLLTLEEYYSANQSWEGVADQWNTLQNTFASQAQMPPEVNPPPGDTPPQDFGPRRLFGLADPLGLVIVSIDPKYPEGSNLPAADLETGTSIEVGGVNTGILLSVTQMPWFNPAESRFLRQTTEVLLYSLGIGMLVALLIGILLARTLTRPLQALTRASRSIATGDLQQEVQVRSGDEIGELASTFNLMSREVARSNQLRRQMTADIAHDLRTPLTTISGYVESMIDGVLAPTPERLSLIYTEIGRLQDLVGDLRILSQADAGELPMNPQPIAPRALLDRAAGFYRLQASRQEISLAVEVPDSLPELLVDEARMMQVLGNLLTNALRYTPSGGHIQLGAENAGGSVRLRIQDNGSGIDPQNLERIFDRFHRADPSRHSENGESGLGLAIVKALVESQGGRVWAESTPGTGATILIELPNPTPS